MRVLRVGTCSGCSGVARRAFQLSATAGNTSWLTYLSLSVAVTGQVKEAWLPYGHTRLELVLSAVA